MFHDLAFSELHRCGMEIYICIASALWGAILRHKYRP